MFWMTLLPPLHPDHNITQCHIPEDLKLNLHCCENLKSHTQQLVNTEFVGMFMIYLYQNFT